MGLVNSAVQAGRPQSQLSRAFLGFLGSFCEHVTKSINVNLDVDLKRFVTSHIEVDVPILRRDAKLFAVANFDLDAELMNSSFERRICYLRAGVPSDGYPLPSRERERYLASLGTCDW